MDAARLIAVFTNGRLEVIGKTRQAVKRGGVFEFRRLNEIDDALTAAPCGDTNCIGLTAVTDDGWRKNRLSSRRVKSAFAGITHRQQTFM